jgi:hypothetical protein
MTELIFSSARTFLFNPKNEQNPLPPLPGDSPFSGPKINSHYMQRMNIGDGHYTERLAAGKIRCQRNCSILIIVQQKS